MTGEDEGGSAAAGDSAGGDSAGGHAAGGLRFGVNLGRGEVAEVAGAALEAERLGFDIVTAADHWGSADPFVLLAAAAAVTRRVRLRSYVLDLGFWHPALLSRTVSTLDALSGGRVDLGVGAGHMRHEHEALGLPFPSHRERVDAMEAAVRELRERLADPGHGPSPVQRPVPLLVGAMSAAGLGVAARLADVVAFSGLLQVPRERAGTFTLASAARTDERVALVRRLAGDRPVTFDALLQRVVVDRPPAQAAAEFAADLGGRISPEAVLDSPFLLLAESPRAGAEELGRRAARWGITSWCTHPPSGPALAEVVAVARS